MEQEKSSYAYDSHQRAASDGRYRRGGAGTGDNDKQVDRGQIGVIVLIVLAVVATVVMLLSNSETALRLALLASLWSAVIGFFLVTRYRRQAQDAEQRVADHERFVREQQESRTAGAAAQPALADAYPNTVDAHRFEEMWEDIRNELSVIRTHLEELQDRGVGYEPAALQAEARRIRDLGQQPHQANSAFSFDQAGAGLGAGSYGAPSREAIAGNLGSQPSQPQPNPLSALISEREQEKQSQRVEYKPAETVKAEPAAAKPAAPKTAAPKPAQPKPAAGKPLRSRLPRRTSSQRRQARALLRRRYPGARTACAPTMLLHKAPAHTPHRRRQPAARVARMITGHTGAVVMRTPREFLLPSYSSARRNKQRAAVAPR